MPAIPLAENVLGTVGAFLWSIQLLPQIVKSYREKDTAGLSASMLAIWIVSAIFLGAYVVRFCFLFVISFVFSPKRLCANRRSMHGWQIVQNISIPLVVQPQCFMLLGAISWSQVSDLSHRCTRVLRSSFSMLTELILGFAE